LQDRRNAGRPMDRHKDKHIKELLRWMFLKFLLRMLHKSNLLQAPYLLELGSVIRGKKREIGKGGILQKRGLLEWVPRDLGLVRDQEARRGSDYISYFYDCFSMERVNGNCHFGNSFCCCT